MNHKTNQDWRSRSFEPTIVYVDPAKGWQGLTTAFPGVTIDLGGAGDHLAKVDAKIRRIKELYRSVKNTLPWKLPQVMIKDLVAYAVARNNIKRTTAINQNVCPKVLFTGIKVNFKKELELAFGDYCEVYDGTDNTSASQSVPCIALYPLGNSTGSWCFMNLKTKTRIRRSHWRAMTTTELIVDVLNFFDDKPATETSVEPQAEQIISPEVAMPEVVEEPAILQEQNDEEVPDLVDAPDDEDTEDEESVTEEIEPELSIATQTRSRTGTDTRPPERYTMAVKETSRKKQERD